MSIYREVENVIFVYNFLNRYLTSYQAHSLENLTDYSSRTDGEMVPHNWKF